MKFVLQVLFFFSFMAVLMVAVFALLSCLLGIFLHLDKPMFFVLAVVSILLVFGAVMWEVWKE